MAQSHYSQMPVEAYMRFLKEEEQYVEDMGRLVRFWARIEMVLDAQVCVRRGLPYEQTLIEFRGTGDPTKRWASLFPNRDDFYSDDAKLFRQVEFLRQMRNMVGHAESRQVDMAVISLVNGRPAQTGAYHVRRMNAIDPRSRRHSDYAAAIYALVEGKQQEGPDMWHGGVPLLCFAYYANAAEDLLAKLYTRLVELKGQAAATPQHSVSGS